MSSRVCGCPSGAKARHILLRGGTASDCTGLEVHGKSPELAEGRSRRSQQRNLQAARSRTLIFNGTRSGFADSTGSIIPTLRKHTPIRLLNGIAKWSLWSPLSLLTAALTRPSLIASTFSRGMAKAEYLGHPQKYGTRMGVCSP